MGFGAPRLGILAAMPDDVARPADHESPTTITAYPDGPLLVRGDFVLRTAQGAVVETRRSTVALCRCGQSALKPFCDGTHKAIGFRTE